MKMAGTSSELMSTVLFKVSSVAFALCCYVALKREIASDFLTDLQWDDELLLFSK
jgi:hypothetical protein